MFFWIYWPLPCQTKRNKLLCKFCNKIMQHFLNLEGEPKWFHQFHMNINNYLIFNTYFNFLQPVQMAWSTHLSPLVVWQLFSRILSRSRHRTTNFPNSESWIFTTKFYLLAWSTVGQDTMQCIYWNHATFSNSF